MKSARASRELVALLPWLAAALVWVALVSPMRADQDLRLRDQARIRRDRVKADRKTREIQILRARIGNALSGACRASADPAALRQRVVVAAESLPLSPFSLSVAGGPGAGASVEAAGPPPALAELLRRLGDPARGGFLRSVSLRERGGRFSVQTQTGVIEAAPQGFGPSLPACGAPPTPSPTPEPPRPKADKAKPRAAVRPGVTAPSPTIAPMPVAPAPPPAPPFSLVAFLQSGGRARVSVRMGDEVRVVSVGDQVAGWRCVSIDRDEGAAFVSAAGVRAILQASPSAR